MNINFLPKEFKARSFLKSFTNNRLRATVAAILIGVLSLGLIQSHLNIENSANSVTSRVLAGSYALASTDITRVIFGDEVETNAPEITEILERQTKLITTRPSFLAALKVVQNNEATIVREAEKAGVPVDIAIGIAFLENGGSESATSVAGARGMYQFMPSTARSYGLTVSGSHDDRLDPEKSTKAAMHYLTNNYKLLKDWGLTTWSYHAGAGNVCKAVRAYAANNGQTLSGCSSEIGDYVRAQGLTIHKLFSDPAVQNITSRLKDDSVGYAYKVMADAHIYRLANDLGTEELVKRVTLLNTRVWNVNQFFSS